MKLKYLALAGLLGFTACDDVIDLKPLDSFTDESYWTSVDDLRGYANRFYTNLSGPSSSGDEQSDNRVPSNYDAWLYNEYVVDQASDWSWSNIRNLNFFMARYQRVEGTEADINAQVAVIRFFRALDYFGKIKSYGDVPWYEKDLTDGDTEELFKPRDSRDFVLGKIIEDLEFAIQWLPEQNAAAECALHKDAARTQLSRVCLYYGTFKKYHNVGGTPSSQELLQKAASNALAVMNTGRYEIVKGQDAGCGQQAFEGYPLYYQNQFVQEDLSGNKEAILFRKYEDGVLMHATGRSQGVGYSKDFAESFLCKDGKPIGVSDLYQGDETIDQEMINRDPRMYNIIDNVHRPYTVQADGTIETTFSKYDKNSSAPNVSASGSVTGYANVKFSSADPTQWVANATTYDWFVYRYAEVLLNYAEAKYELGEMSQDVLDKTINLLRDRVEMPHLTMNVGFTDPNWPDYGYDVDPLLQEIRRERRIELVAEGFRYDDIIRWKGVKLYENPKTVLGIRVTDKVISLYDEGTFGGDKGRALVEYEGKTYIRPYSKDLNDAGRKWSADDKRFLNPISKNVMLINPAITQNPGW